MKPPTDCRGAQKKNLRTWKFCYAKVLGLHVIFSQKIWHTSQQVCQGVLETSWETNGKLHDRSLEGGVRRNWKQWFVWIIVWISQDIEGVKVGNTISEEVKMLKFYVKYLWKLSKKAENKYNFGKIKCTKRKYKTT